MESDVFTGKEIQSQKPELKKEAEEEEERKKRKEKKRSTYNCRKPFSKLFYFGCFFSATHILVENILHRGAPLKKYESVIFRSIHSRCHVGVGLVA